MFSSLPILPSSSLFHIALLSSISPSVFSIFLTSLPSMPPSSSLSPATCHRVCMKGLYWPCPVRSLSLFVQGQSASCHAFSKGWGVVRVAHCEFGSGEGLLRTLEPVSPPFVVQGLSLPPSLPPPLAPSCLPSIPLLLPFSGVNNPRQIRYGRSGKYSMNWKTRAQSQDHGEDICILSKVSRSSSAG